MLDQECYIALTRINGYGQYHVRDLSSDVLSYLLELGFIEENSAPNDPNQTYLLTRKGRSHMEHYSKKLEHRDKIEGSLKFISGCLVIIIILLIIRTPF